MQKFDELELKKVEIDKRERRISEREGVVETCEKLRKHLLEREDLIIENEIKIDERIRFVSVEESRLSAKEKRLSDQLIQIQKDKSEARALLKKRDKLEGENRSLEAKNESLQVEKSRLQTSIKRLKEESKTLPKPSSILRIKSENTKLNKENKKKAEEIKRLKMELSILDSQPPPVSPAFSITDFELLHALSCEVNDLFYPPNSIVTLGSGPFPESDFDDYLKSLGITPYADGYPWIIIGRDDWSEEQLDALIDDAELGEVRVFSQELFMAGILTTHDPFSLPLEILMKFAEGHPALTYLIEQGFEWPEIVIEKDYGKPKYLGGTYYGEEESPLVLKGYHAGVTCGLSPLERRDFLESAYKEEIDYVGDDEYMEEWGHPGRSKRLWRIAHHLAWLIRSRKSNRDMRYAVKDWQADLDWLEKQFYTNRMRFKWPHG